jgi:hypothetical protein
MAVEVTFNGGETFTELDTPTSQFYHVSVDNEFPYNIYGQQDNSSIRIASRSSGSIGPESWYAAAGGEAGYIEADPTNADIYIRIRWPIEFFQQKNRSRKRYLRIQNRILAPSVKKCFQWTYPIFRLTTQKNVCYFSGCARDRRSRSFI